MYFMGRISRLSPKRLLLFRVCHCPHSLQSRVCKSVRRTAANPLLRGLLLWVWLAGDVDRLLHGAQQLGMQPANAGSATLSAYVVAEHRLV